MHEETEDQRDLQRQVDPQCARRALRKRHDQVRGTQHRDVDPVKRGPQRAAVHFQHHQQDEKDRDGLHDQGAGHHRAQARHRVFYRRVAGAEGADGDFA